MDDKMFEKSVKSSNLTLEVQIKKHHGIALASSDQNIDYPDLDRKIQRRAIALQHVLATMPDTPTDAQTICLVLSKSTELVVTLLAIWRLNLVGALLDPFQSSATREILLSQIQPKLTIIEDPIENNQINNGLANTTNPTLSLSNLMTHENNTETLTLKPLRPSSKDTEGAAYIGFTSGSVSKFSNALLNTHTAITLAAQAHIETLKIAPCDRVLQVSRIGFDAIYLEIYMTLLAGATLVIPNSYENNPYDDIHHFLTQQSITIAILAGSVAAALTPTNYPHLRALVLTGEAIARSEFERWGATHHCMTYNGYGLVQDGVCTTLYSPSATENQNTPSIGTHAIAGKELILIDAQGKVNQTQGQLCISGSGLALGYYVNGRLQQFSDNTTTKQDSENQNRWLVSGFDSHKPNIFSKPVRIYKTGDIFRKVQGHYYIEGRVDRQIDIAGVSFQPEQIETAIKNILTRSIKQQAIVFVATLGVSSAKKLHALIIYSSVNSAAFNSLTYRDIYHALHQEFHLSAMIPAIVYCLTSDNPQQYLNNNGKLDLKKLLEILKNSEYLGTKSLSVDNLITIPPRNRIEELVQAIWQHQLSLPKEMPIDVHTELALMGGGSVAIYQILSRINEDLELNLSIQNLNNTFTIAALASHIVRTVLYSFSVVLSHPTDAHNANTPAVFFIHPVSGAITDYVDLVNSNNLRTKYRVYTCCDPRLIDTRKTPQQIGGIHIEEFISAYHRFYNCETTEAQAKHLAAAIELRIGREPASLAGWSYGGILACYTAEFLAKKRHDVAFIGLLDTPAPMLPNIEPRTMTKKFGWIARFITEKFTASLLSMVESVVKDNTIELEDYEQQRQKILIMLETISQHCQTIEDEKLRIKIPYYERLLQSTATNFIAGYSSKRTSPYQFTANICIYQSTKPVDGTDDAYQATSSEWERLFSQTVTTKPVKDTHHLNIPKSPETSILLTQDIDAIYKKSVTTPTFSVFNGISLVNNFVARETLLVNLHQMLQTRKRQRGLLVNVYGYGGQGKSQLLANYAERYHKDYPGKVYWINADTTASLKADYQRLADSLSISCKNIEQTALAIKYWFEDRTDWLLIFDDVSKIEDIQPHIPISKNGVVVLMTREKVTFDDFPVDNFFLVDCFTNEQATSFIRQALDSELLICDAEIQGMITRLSASPIGLAQACALINQEFRFNNQYTITTFNDLYDSQPKQLHNHRTRRLLKRNESLTTIWNMTSTRILSLLEESQTVGFLATVTHFAFLNPNLISFKLIEKLNAKFSSNRLGFTSSLECLSNYSVIKPNQNINKDRTYQIHRLLQDVIFFSMPQIAQFSTLAHIVRIVNAEYNDPDGIRSQRELSYRFEQVPHFDRLLDRCINLLNLFFDVESFEKLNEEIPLDEILLLTVMLIQTTKIGYEAFNEVDKILPLYIKVMHYLFQVIAIPKTRDLFAKQISKLGPDEYLKVRQALYALYCFFSENLAPNDMLAQSFAAFIPYIMQESIYEYIHSHSFNVVSYFYRKLLVHQNDHSKSIKVVMTCLEQKLSVNDIRCLAQILLQMGCYQELWNFVRQRKEENYTPDLLYSIAMALFNLSNFRDAINYLDRIFEDELIVLDFDNSRCHEPFICSLLNEKKDPVQFHQIVLAVYYKCLCLYKLNSHEELLECIQQLNLACTKYPTTMHNRLLSHLYYSCGFQNALEIKAKENPTVSSAVDQNRVEDHTETIPWIYRKMTEKVLKHESDLRKPLLQSLGNLFRTPKITKEITLDDDFALSYLDFIFDNAGELGDESTTSNSGINDQDEATKSLAQASHLLQEAIVSPEGSEGVILQFNNHESADAFLMALNDLENTGLIPRNTDRTLVDYEENDQIFYTLYLNQGEYELMNLAQNVQSDNPSHTRHFI